MKKQAIFLLVLFNIIFLSSLVVAEEDDLMLLGFELEKLLNLGSGLLAMVLFILTLYAYKRLLYVSIAFILFAVKGILVSLEMFFEDWSWVDPIASILDFAMLLSFFSGILKK